MTHPIITRALSTVVLAGAAIAAPALAQSTEAPTSVSVAYRDLDLSHPAGAAVLVSRIRVAAEKACGGAPDVRLLSARVAFDKCRSMAISQAVAEVDAPLVTAAAVKSGGVVRIARR